MHLLDSLERPSYTKQKRKPRLHYEVDHGALTRLTNERLGRTLLVTNHLQWTAGQVIEAYRGLAKVEGAFKNMFSRRSLHRRQGFGGQAGYYGEVCKNIAFLRWQPAYHWTDQKIRVHGFYCVLALLLCTLARKQAFEAGIELSLPAMLKELSAIREVAVIYPKGTLAHPKNHIAITRMSARQRKLAEALNLATTLIAG